MAFCTSCGATVQGAFCQQCGTPLSAAATQPAAPQTPPVAAAPVKGKDSPFVWILVTLAGIVVLCIIGVGVAALYVVKNPGTVMAKIITAANPDAEVLSTDPGSQTVRIRDRKTGEEVTLSFDDVKQGRFRISGKGQNGEMGSVEIGGGAGKLPSWVPTYPGARAQGNVTASGHSADGMGEGGVVTFTTPDTPSKVMAFYESKCKDSGMSVAVSQVTDSGGMIEAQDEDETRKLHVTVTQGSGETSMAVTYGRKR